MEDTNSLIEQRRAKLASLRAKGFDPFRNKFTPSETCAEAHANYQEGREVQLAGRITAHRDHVNVMIALTEDTLQRHHWRLKQRPVTVFDSQSIASRQMSSTVLSSSGLWSRRPTSSRNCW